MPIGRSILFGVVRVGRHFVTAFSDCITHVISVFVCESALMWCGVVRKLHLNVQNVLFNLTIQIKWLISNMITDDVGRTKVMCTYHLVIVCAINMQLLSDPPTFN